jgi:hypothetical protein
MQEQAFTSNDMGANDSGDEGEATPQLKRAGGPTRATARKYKVIKRNESSARKETIQRGQ